MRYEVTLNGEPVGEGLLLTETEMKVAVMDLILPLQGDYSHSVKVYKRSGGQSFMVFHNDGVDVIDVLERG